MVTINMNNIKRSHLTPHSTAYVIRVETWLNEIYASHQFVCCFFFLLASTSWTVDKTLHFQCTSRHHPPTIPPSIRTSAIRVLVRPRIMATCLPRELTEINMRKVAAQGFWSHFNSWDILLFCLRCSCYYTWTFEQYKNTTLRFLELSFSGKLPLTCLINVSI